MFVIFLWLKRLQTYVRRQYVEIEENWLAKILDWSTLDNENWKTPAETGFQVTSLSWAVRTKSQNKNLSVVQTSVMWQEVRNDQIRFHPSIVYNYDSNFLMDKQANMSARIFQKMCVNSTCVYLLTAIPSRSFYLHELYSIKNKYNETSL